MYLVIFDKNISFIYVLFILIKLRFCIGDFFFFIYIDILVINCVVGVYIKKVYLYKKYMYFVYKVVLINSGLVIVGVLLICLNKYNFNKRIIDIIEVFFLFFGMV